MVKVEATPAAMYGKFFPGLWVPDKEFLTPILAGGVGVPWGAWIGPLAFWFIFMFAGAYLFMSSLAILLRRRWVEEERLAFPLGTIAVTMLKGTAARTRPEERRAYRVMAGALAISFAINLPWVLKIVYPWMPSIYGWEKSPYIHSAGIIDLAKLT